jgi:hypothetical protein
MAMALLRQVHHHAARQGAAGSPRARIPTRSRHPRTRTSCDHPNTTNGPATPGKCPEHSDHPTVPDNPAAASGATTAGARNRLDHADKLVTGADDGTYAKTNLPDELVLTNYFSVRECRIEVVIRNEAPTY